jgi:aminopeptidase YwaD
MKKNINIVMLSFVMLFLINANSQNFIKSYGDVANKVSQDNVNNYLKEYEALGVKTSGTTALANTLDWLKKKYTSYGYSASQLSEDVFVNSKTGKTDTNLILTKIGTVFPNRYVIVCAHYDSTVGTGTNDNGTGTVFLLEVARLLQKIPTEYSIKFINFSGEEDVFLGSINYVKKVVNSTKPKMDIKLVFNIDEIGGVAGKVNNTIICERDEIDSPSTNNAASNKVNNELIKCVSLYSTLKTTVGPAYSTDYIPFEANNEIITGFFEANLTPHKHTITDLLKNMDSVYVYNVIKAGVGAVMHFAVASTTLNNETFEKDYQVSLYPNPATEFINIYKGILSENNYQFKLIDINGKIILEKDITNSNLVEKINLKNISSGMYLAVISADNKRITKKIIID